MPGLGKTTVAWKIRRDKGIQEEFPTIIWVNVSQEFNKKDVFLTILKKFTDQDMSGKKEDELAPMVREYLEERKFLLFLDDVWTPEAWDQIKAVLPRRNQMSKVLITSRLERVALRASRSPPHKLRFLTTPESWELLQLEVFGELKKFPADLERVGILIAEKCDGLPLALVVIGGILVEIQGTSKEEEWKKVSDSVKTRLVLDDEEKHVENIISLSYADLPYDLRECFLYLGMFPEDTELPASKLTKLWIAEGFIRRKREKSLEEVAQDNLKDLINRNLVIVDKTKLSGEVKTCHVHGMIRKFCKSEASLGNQNLFQEIKKSGGVFEPPVQEREKCRRHCIHSSVSSFFREKPKVPNARSFLCFSKESIILENTDIAHVTDAFSLVRVLELKIIKFPTFPIKITKLIHLRYITLSGDEFEVLPEAISKLWNIQTITVDTIKRTLEIKADIWMMMQLRHVKTKAAIILKEDGKGKGGEYLQTLSRLSPKSCTNETFDKAKNLKTLGVRGEIDSLLDWNCFRKLAHLEKLKLLNDVPSNEASENPLNHLPDSNRFPPNLRTLILSNTYLDWKHMSTLGELNTLKELKLKDNAFVGYIWDTVSGGFHNLIFLFIERTDLMFWKASSEHFPKLRSLVLKNCNKLKEVPSGLGKNLEILSIERVTKSAVSSARNIELEKQNVPGQQNANWVKFKLKIAPGDA